MGVFIWLIAALVLACGELAIGDFTLLMLAGGALAAAGVSLAHVPTWVEAVVFGVTSIGMIFSLRPMLRKRLLTAPTLDTSVQALVGATAPVIETVDPHGGQIRLDGSIWSARSLDPSETFAVGDTVNVISIDGATAVIWKAQ